MDKIWFGLIFAALIAQPASAQDYHKNFVECTKELGMRRDVGIQRLSDGRVVGRWYFQSEAQQALFSDCVARKASLTSKPSAKAAQRTSR
jgi:hypothetical protein